MKTANEMMEAAQKYQVVNLPVFAKAFSEIEKMLRPDEDVLCAFTGSIMYNKLRKLGSKKVDTACRSLVE